MPTTSRESHQRSTPDEPATGAWTPQALAAIGAIGAIGSAPDAAVCLHRFHAAAMAMGASAGLYCVLIPEADGHLSSITLFACEPAFAQGFEPPMPERHPWLRYARHHTTAIAADQLIPQGEADEEALNFAARHGFEACLLVPIAAGAELGRTELLCLGAPRPHHREASIIDALPFRAMAHALAAELHAWFTCQLQASLRQEARLLPQDIQVLAWEWQGLSTKEISHRSGLSAAAVDSRFQRLNVRLRCANRRASARRAAEYGLLEAAPPSARRALSEGGAAVPAEAGQSQAGRTSPQ